MVWRCIHWGITTTLNNEQKHLWISKLREFQCTFTHVVHNGELVVGFSISGARGTQSGVCVRCSIEPSSWKDNLNVLTNSLIFRSEMEVLREPFFKLFLGMIYIVQSLKPETLNSWHHNTLISASKVHAHSQKVNKVIEILILPGKLKPGTVIYKSAQGIQVSPINILDRKGRCSHFHKQYFKVDFNLNQALWIQVV